MDNQQERPGSLETGWLIGAMEGEGCLTVVRSKWRTGKMYHNVAIILSNTNKAFIERVARNLESLGVGHHIAWYSVEQQAQYNRRVKRPMGRLTIWGCKRVAKFLSQTINLWEAKRPQAQLLLDFTKRERPYCGPEFDRFGELSRGLNQGILTDYTSNMLLHDDIVGPQSKG